MSGRIDFLHRRACLRCGSLYLLGNYRWSTLLASDLPARRLRFGLVTDLHHADKPSAGTRHYRETLGKLAEAARQFSDDPPDGVVELGDFIDAADSVEAELRYLKEIQRAFQQLPGEKHYVLGNHCVDWLTKEEFLQGIGRQESFYSFELGDFHFVVLDACFRADGQPYGRKSAAWTDANIPPHELAWLQADLRATAKKTIVFAHQRLDLAGKHAVRNAAAVREVLEASGKVLAVLQGHSHGNDYQEIHGIHYCTLVAMVEGSGPENNGYAVMDILADQTICIHGYRQQRAYQWS